RGRASRWDTRPRDGMIATYGPACEKLGYGPPRSAETRGQMKESPPAARPERRVWSLSRGRSGCWPFALAWATGVDPGRRGRQAVQSSILIWPRVSPAGNLVECTLA